MQIEQNRDFDNLSDINFDLIIRMNPESNYNFIVSEIQIDNQIRNIQSEQIIKAQTYIKNNFDYSLIFYKSLLVSKILTDLSQLQISFKIQMSPLQNAFVGYVIIQGSMLLIKPLLEIQTINETPAGHHLSEIMKKKMQMLMRKKDYIRKNITESILCRRLKKKKIQEILQTQFQDFVSFKQYFRQVINFLYNTIYKYSKYTQQKTKHYKLLLRLVYATSIHHLQYENLHIFQNLYIWIQKHGYTNIGQNLESYIQNSSIMAAKEDMNYIMHTQFAKLK